MAKTGNTGNRSIGFSLFWAVVLISGTTSPSWADTLYNRYLDGESSYQSEDYDEALNSFIDAQIESPEDARLKYNIANAHYKTRNYDEAIKSYLDVAATAQDISLEESSYYNLGNCLYRQGKLPEAVEYYKRALDLDPEDQDAKYNLEFVREEIKRRMNEAKKRQEQQQNGQSQEQSPDQQKGERQSGSEEKRQESSQGEKDQAQDGTPESGKEEQKQAQGAGEQKRDEPGRQKDEKTVAQKKKMSPEEAERWLKGLPDDQKEILKKQLKNQFSGEYSPEKDW